jgi:hypothetical protein
VSPSILVATTDAAIGSTTNPLQGSQYEFLSFDAFVQFAIYADTGDTFTLSVFSGSDVLMQNAPMPILATATPILYPDHFYLEDGAGAGERLGVQAVNTLGAVASFRTLVRITPL